MVGASIVKGEMKVQYRCEAAGVGRSTEELEGIVRRDVYLGVKRVVVVIFCCGEARWCGCATWTGDVWERVPLSKIGIGRCVARCVVGGVL